MFITYVIRNSLSGKHYIGSTNNLTRRLSEHNRGQTRSTNKKGIWKVIYLEEFTTSLQAKNRELKIKSYKGGKAFKKLISSVELPATAG